VTHDPVPPRNLTLRRLRTGAPTPRHRSAQPEPERGPSLQGRRCLPGRGVEVELATTNRGERGSGPASVAPASRPKRGRVVGTNTAVARAAAQAAGGRRRTGQLRERTPGRAPGRAKRHDRGGRLAAIAAVTPARHRRARGCGRSRLPLIQDTAGAGTAGSGTSGMTLGRRGDGRLYVCRRHRMWATVVVGIVVAAVALRNGVAVGAGGSGRRRGRRGGGAPRAGGRREDGRSGGRMWPGGRGLDVTVRNADGSARPGCGIGPRRPHDARVTAKRGRWAGPAALRG